LPWSGCRGRVARNAHALAEAHPRRRESDRRSANWTLEIALPLLERAARAPVKSTVGGADAFASVEAAVRDGDYDELIVSTLPRRFSRWLRRDLISQIAELGLPVTAIVPRRAPAVAAAEEALRTPRDLGGGP
jgi:hypothetical protein